MFYIFERLSIGDINKIQSPDDTIKQGKSRHPRTLISRLTAERETNICLKKSLFSDLFPQKLSI